MARVNITQTKKKNKALILQLKKDLRSLPTKVLASAGISAFRSAVRATYQDSGQFALNWTIKAGQNPAFIGPQYYRTRGFVKKGQKRTDRGDTEVLIAQVMSVHGLPTSKYAKVKTSKLYKDIVKGGFSYVSISNPFWSPKFGGESYSPSGHSGYPSRTVNRPGHRVKSAANKAAARASYEAFKALVK